MNPSSLLFSPTPTCSSSFPLFPSRRPYFSTPIVKNSESFHSIARFPAASSPSLPTLAITGSTEKSQEVEVEQEEGADEEDFIEVGYISKVHGLKGEVRVKPNTDFPQLRFSEPGKRWLRARITGREVVSEVELTAGRSHPGQKCWIISLKGVDTVDEAKQIIGSSLLVREEDRPELEEGEFYTRDLVGMRVVLKETGRPVGTVVNVFNNGASDLLQVMLNSTEEKIDHSNSSKPYIGASGPLVWVPFVEAIVPEVDMNGREMHITPPKGLLELNLRSDTRSKKERRQLEWKERKKFQHRLITAKKRISEMRQDHVLEGLRVGGKAEKGMLAKQIVDINFKLFQHAVQSINMPFSRSSRSPLLDLLIQVDNCGTVLDFSAIEKFNLSEFMYANSSILAKNALNISVKSLVDYASEGRKDNYYEIHKGLQLLVKSKAAIIVVMNDADSVGICSEPDDASISRPDSKLHQFQELILNYKKLLQVEKEGIAVPFILVSPDQEICLFEELLADNNYFGLDQKKVWLLKEEKLPIVSASSDNNKILLKSSWEILQASTGSGGIFSSLSSHKIVDNLIEMGIEYVQVHSLEKKSRFSAIGNPMLLGLVKSREADIGVKILTGKNEDENGGRELDMVFSVGHLNKMCKQSDKLHFCPVPEKHVHVELVEEESGNHVHSYLEEPNSYRFHSSIHSALKNCSLDKICTLYIGSE